MPKAIERLKYNFMNGHGKKHFLAGLDKLGIRNDPPAIAAAKYHYMGNDLIGDVPMEYIRETDRKVWIRYLAPLSSSGLGLSGLGSSGMPGICAALCVSSLA
ncbi:siphovirus Gp157 family protein [Bradyrhizobium sp. 76]|uniref:siphovirus Gp157 family protein n=1 Tax=Bradyrhizobium sp. 76 TaxID=2782680 RepID=UPI001FF8FC5F|nr:siphovirus Gp157 family protein [Bradyrhizobium sp. 76]MCK1410394.1 hypothetical protein [Bradyrhizobium sp. 76]